LWKIFWSTLKPTRKENINIMTGINLNKKVAIALDIAKNSELEGGVE
jgi:hypothetical protein